MFTSVVLLLTYWTVCACVLLCVPVNPAYPYMTWFAQGARIAIEGNEGHGATLNENGTWLLDWFVNFAVLGMCF